jgi:hypothetical protein
MYCPISSEERCALIQSTTVIGGCFETFPGIGSGPLDSYVPFQISETDSDDFKSRPCDPCIILRFRREYRVKLEPTKSSSGREICRIQHLYRQLPQQKKRPFVGSWFNDVYSRFESIARASGMISQTGVVAG